MDDKPSFDPSDFLRNIAEAGRGVRLGRGVVGKTGHSMLALLGIWGVIAARIGESILMDIGLGSIGVAATLTFIWWTRSSQLFAERNPAQAMLEGAEFIEYKKFEAAAKGGLIEYGVTKSEDAVVKSEDGE